jgi:hypothetical membrane protein
MQPQQDSVAQTTVGAANRRGAQRGALLALVTIGGIVLYVTLDVIAQVLPPHYNPIRQPESDLAVGPYGFIMTINFVLRGLLSLALVGALAGAVSRKALSRTGLALVGLWGVGALLLAAFPTDLSGAPPTLHGIVHLIIATLAFIGAPIGELLLARRFTQDERWRALGAPAQVIAILAIIAAFILLVVTPTSRTLSHVGGLTERIFIGLILLWMLVIAIRLHALLTKK